MMVLSTTLRQRQPSRCSLRNKVNEGTGVSPPHHLITSVRLLCSRQAGPLLQLHASLLTAVLNLITLEFTCIGPNFLTGHKTPPCHCLSPFWLPVTPKITHSMFVLPRRWQAPGGQEISCSPVYPPWSAWSLAQGRHPTNISLVTEEKRIDQVNSGF